MHGAEIHSFEYGLTAGGLPVFVDDARTWLSAIRVSKRRGLTPADFGWQRVYWHEKCLAVSRAHHAAGKGNGQAQHLMHAIGFVRCVNRLRKCVL